MQTSGSCHDLAGITNIEERRKVQNRVAQRKHRKKMRKNSDRIGLEFSNSFSTPPPPRSRSSSGLPESGLPPASTWDGDTLQWQLLDMNNPQTSEEQHLLTNTLEHETVPSYPPNQILPSVPASVLSHLFPEMTTSGTGTPGTATLLNHSPYLGPDIRPLTDGPWSGKISAEDSSHDERVGMSISNEKMKIQQTTECWRRKARLHAASHLERKAEQIVSQLFKLYESASFLGLMQEDPGFIEQLRGIQSHFSPLTLTASLATSDSNMDWRHQI